MNKKTYIIILNYNGWQDTIECLESVLKSDYKNYQIIVVDNDSPDNSMEHIIKWAEGKQEVIYDENSEFEYLTKPFTPKPLEYVYYDKKEALAGDAITAKEAKLDNPLVFIQAGENRGFSAGNNIGIKYALAKNDFEYIWLLNPDTLILPDTLKKLINYTQNQPKDVGIVGTALLYHHDKKRLQALGGSFNSFFSTGKHILGYEEYNEETISKFNIKDVDMIIGASMLIRREVLEKVGLLEEQYFIYFEEIDYALRAKKYGYKLGLEPRAIVYHKEGASINKESRKDSVSDFSDFYAMRNRILLTKKLQPQFLPTVLSGLFISAVLRISRKEYAKAWMIIKIIFGKRIF